jgi:probable rRNA maturation factor
VGLEEPSIAIDCVLRSDDWAALPGAETLAARAARAALDAASGAPGGFSEGGELSLALSDDAELQILNKAYRGKDGPTNVLSFHGDTDTHGGPVQLGDVVLAYGVCAREAEAQGKSLADHMSHLVVHGVLHLLGHDHEAEAEAARMEALEVRVLAGLGIADPYAAETAAAEAER